MSGVFGIVDLDKRVDVSALAERMAAAMSHYDWFVTDRYADAERSVALGRIGIGVFNPQPQPVWNAARTVALVMAGEFHNRPPEMESDEQFALSLYEQKGEDLPRWLEGAFVLAIWDSASQRVLVINDRAGLYPLCYAYYQHRLIFAPEMQGILCDAGFPKALDLRALAEYVRFQCLLGDKTFFEDLKLLPNASLLRLDLATGQLSVGSYWDFSQLPQLPASFDFEDAVAETGRLLKAAVARSTRGKYRLGLYLTGGLDARAILGLVDCRPQSLSTITYGPRTARDVIYAARLAKRAGTRHYYFDIPDGRWVPVYAEQHLELTEGFHSWIHAHGFNVLPQARAVMDVNLTGFGGGELNWEDPALFHAPDDLAFATRLLHLLSQEITWPSLNQAEEHWVFASPLAAQLRGLAQESFYEELSRQSHLSYERRAVHFSFSADRRMFQYHTVFNRSHIEQRFPFCDYAYLEFIHAVPPEMRFQRRLRRAVVRRLMPDLASVPYDKDELPITDSSAARAAMKLWRAGKRFVNHHLRPVFPEYLELYADYETWLRRELRDWGEGLLLGPRTVQRGIFNPDFLKSLWQRQLSGLEQNILGKLAPLMTYEMLLRRFYDGA